MTEQKPEQGSVQSGPTTTAAAVVDSPPLTMAVLDAAIVEFERVLRQQRRDNVTLVVVLGHQGEMLYSEHPTDGRFVECSFQQALVLQQRVGRPFRLVRVVSVDRAHFEVASPLLGSVFTPLIPPPYVVTAEFTP